MNKYIRGTILLLLISSSAYFGLTSFLGDPLIKEMKLGGGGKEMNPMRDSLSLPLIEEHWVIHELDSTYAYWAARNKSVTSSNPMHLYKDVNYIFDEVDYEVDAFHFEGVDSIAYRLICEYYYKSEISSFRLIEYYKGKYPPTKGFELSKLQADSIFKVWGFADYY